METYFGISFDKVVTIVIATLLIFIAIILLTRLSGKRSFSKMSSFDFASTIAIGSIIASGILLKDVTPSTAITALTTIFALQTLIAYLRRFGIIHKIIDNQPLLLMDGSTILVENLKKARVTEDDLRSKLRAANVLDISEVRAVVLESTGNLSVLHTSDKKATVQEWLLDGVRR
ncbi:DUF421 domain-containing protein [Flavobacterium sp. SM2513]|uniref:DUF421 domain-containing protein n=1 Tax=Flavobacterium sp. SM2513 TaxID=3424766 RepID=UPI003D7F5E3F